MYSAQSPKRVVGSLVLLLATLALEPLQARAQSLPTAGLGPNLASNITRSNAAYLIEATFNALNTQSAPNNTTFVDDNLDPYHRYQDWLKIDGITSGCATVAGGTDFCPTQTIPLYELLIFFARAGVKYLGQSMATTVNLADFKTDSSGNNVVALYGQAWSTLFQTAINNGWVPQSELPLGPDALNGPVANTSDYIQGTTATGEDLTPTTASVADCLNFWAINGGASFGTYYYCLQNYDSVAIHSGYYIFASQSDLSAFEQAFLPGGVDPASPGITPTFSGEDIYQTWELDVSFRFAGVCNPTQPVSVVPSSGGLTTLTIGAVPLAGTTYWMEVYKATSNPVTHQTSYRFYAGGTELSSNVVTVSTAPGGDYLLQFGVNCGGNAAQSLASYSFTVPCSPGTTLQANGSCE